MVDFVTNYATTTTLNTGNIQSQNSAGSLVFGSPTTMAAAGTDALTATPIINFFVNVIGSDGTNGIRLPSIVTPGIAYWIYNDSPSSVLLYPNGTDTIHNSNSPVTIGSYRAQPMLATSATNWCV